MKPEKLDLIFYKLLNHVLSLLSSASLVLFIFFSTNINNSAPIEKGYLVKLFIKERAAKSLIKL